MKDGQDNVNRKKSKMYVVSSILRRKNREGSKYVSAFVKPNSRRAC